MGTTFRLRTKRFYLTYPQLPAGDYDFTEIALKTYEQIFSLDRTRFNYVISMEKHKDGNDHLHVYLQFEFVQKIYSANKLDLILTTNQGKTMTCHGNYQSVKSQHKTLSYITKESAFETNMELPIHSGTYYSNPHDHLYKVMKTDGLRASIDVLYKLYPSLAVKRGSTILNNLILAAKYKFEANREAKKPRFELQDFKNIPPEIYSWMEKILQWKDV